MHFLNHSRRILRKAHSLYQQKSNGLSKDDQERLKGLIFSLNEASQNEDRASADRYAREVETFLQQKQKKSIYHYTKEIVVALLMALIIATVVRASWFELYQIPTGSMRPNFREQDHLTVSKLPFGINIPLVTGHFLFEPELVQRTSAVTFSGDKIRTLDETTPFLYIFPYKKRLIKRMVGKPGDSLYFYGGKIYGVDKDGNPIDELLSSPWLEKIDYIPYMKLSGEITQTGPNEANIVMMNKPIGKIKVNPFGEISGLIWNGSSWIKDDIEALKKPHETIKTLSDWWGIRNYAMARLLTKEQLKEVSEADPSTLKDGVLYLELRHTPSLAYPKSQTTKNRNGDLLVNPLQTIIPLQEQHLETLMNNLYTARLVFEKGHGYLYSVESKRRESHSPLFAKVPDGTYEFYYGKGYSVGFGATTSPLPQDHPLYSKTPENIQKLFNLGIEMNTAYEPKSAAQPYFPNRYAYFKDGDLYVMGAPLLKKDDPVLTSFIESERKREKLSSPNRPYIAFQDYGAPIKDGKIDADFVRAFGVHVPENQYFVLGDNHAMSGDSRIFGFVPEGNLQGAPSLILWPTGSRWGFPWQEPYPFMNIPRAIVWFIAAVIALLWWIIDRRRLRKNYTV